LTPDEWLEKQDYASMPNCSHFGTGYDLVCWMEETGHWPTCTLKGPDVTKYRVASASSPGAYCTLVVSDGKDVECSCPGYEYRAACRHACDLKQALARGASAPAGYQSAI
jgi:hypothetical protein